MCVDRKLLKNIVRFIRHVENTSNNVEERIAGKLRVTKLKVREGYEKRTLYRV